MTQNSSSISHMINSMTSSRTSPEEVCVLKTCTAASAGHYKVNGAEAQELSKHLKPQQELLEVRFNELFLYKMHHSGHGTRIFVLFMYLKRPSTCKNMYKLIVVFDVCWTWFVKNTSSVVWAKVLCGNELWWRKQTSSFECLSGTVAWRQGHQLSKRWNMLALTANKPSKCAQYPSCL